jgi:CheY-like chemotaxis protein/TolA-binding protein
VAEKRNLLLVDDDPRALRLLEVSLRRAGFHVSTAQSGAEALTRLDECPAEVVITDTAMPDMDGFELCARVREDPRHRMLRFLFLVRETSLEDRYRAVELGADDFIPKPAHAQEVAARVRLLLARRDCERLQEETDATQLHLSGSLADLSVADLVAAFHAARRSGVVHLESEGKQGVLFLREGRVLDTQCGSATGELAFYRLLRWDEGRFEFSAAGVDNPERIALGTQALLQEGLRRIDEWERVEEHLPALDRVFEVSYPVLAARLSEIPDEVNAILRLFDGRRTLLQVTEDAPYDDLATLNVIAKFYADGLIREAEAQPGEGELEIESWLSGRPAREPKAKEEASPREGASPPAAGAPAAPPPALLGNLIEFPRATPRPEEVPRAQPPAGAEAVAPAVPVARAEVSAEPTAPPPSPVGTAPPGAPALAPRTEAATVPPPSEAPAPPAIPSPAAAREPPPAEAPPPPQPAEVPRSRAPAHDEEEWFDASQSGVARAAAVAEGRVEEPAPRARWLWIFGGLVAAAAVVSAVVLWLNREPPPRRRLEPTPSALATRGAPVPARPLAPPAPVPPAAPPVAQAPASAAAQAGTGGVAPAPEAPAVVPVVPPAAEAPPEQEEALLPPEETRPAERRPATAPELIRRGNLLIKRERFAAAQKLFRRAVELDPRSAAARYGLGRALYDGGQEEASLKYFQKAIALKADFSDAYVRLGSIYQNRGQKARAKVAYQTYLKLAPRGKYADEVRSLLQGL